jgi:hypothetical protein
MPMVEVLNRNHYRSCRCLASPAFRLVPIHKRVLDHHCIPHLGQLLRPVLHLDSRTKRRPRVRVEVSPLVPTQSHPRAPVEGSHLARRSLQRTRRLQGSHLVSPLPKVGLRPLVDLHSTSQALRPQTRRLQGSPSRHQSRFNTPRVLHSDRQRLNQHPRPLQAGLLLDKLKPRHRHQPPPPPLLSRLVRL